MINFSCLDPRVWDAEICDELADLLLDAVRAKSAGASTRLLSASAIRDALAAHTVALRERSAADQNAGRLVTYVDGGSVPNSYGFRAATDIVSVTTTLADGEIVAQELTWGRGAARTVAYGGPGRCATHWTGTGPVWARGWKTRAAAERALAAHPGAAVVCQNARYLLEHQNALGRHWTGTGGQRAGRVDLIT